MATTLLLDRDTWDLCLDAEGNIALASEPYSTSQDVASACRVVAGECWFNTTLGITYFDGILGQPVPVELLKSQLVQAALTVPDVTAPVVYLSSVTGRTLTGQVQWDGGIATL